MLFCDQSDRNGGRPRVGIKEGTAMNEPLKLELATFTEGNGRALNCHALDVRLTHMRDFSLSHAMKQNSHAFLQFWQRKVETF